MSIMICDHCEKQVDTDFEEMIEYSCDVKYKTGFLCFNCAEELDILED